MLNLKNSYVFKVLLKCVQSADMSETFSCGFVRALLLQCSKDIHPTKLQREAYRLLTANFVHQLTPSHFTIQYRKLMTILKTKTWDQTEKSAYLSYFHLVKWINLGDEERSRHTMKACTACETDHHAEHGKFAIKKSPPSAKKMLKDITNTTPTAQVSRKDKKDAGECWNRMEADWDRTHTTPLAQAIASRRTSNLVMRKTSNERLKLKRKLQTDIKKHEESLLAEDDIDLDTMLATRQSLNARKKQRKQLFLESKADAIKQAAKRSKRKPKKHALDPDEVDFQRDQMLEYAKAYPQDKKLDLTKTASLFGVPGNKGTVNVTVKTFLSREGIDHPSLSTKERIRRGKKKMQGSTGVSVSSFRTEDKLKEALKRSLENGKYSLGRLIEPKTFKKRVRGDNGPVIEEYTVSGRKIPMIEIREKLNKRHSEMGVLRDGVVKRALLVWSDHASILNHGHLLLTVKPIFHKDTFFTSKEMEEKFDVEIDVQEFVEKQSLYILACTSDSVLEKLCYAKERLDDILDLSMDTHIGNTTVKDVLRLFHGDHPEISFEAGTSKGGQYPNICPTRKEQFTDIVVAYANDIVSIDQRRKSVVIGPAGRKEGANPFDQLSYVELAEEIALRNVDTFRKDGKEPTKADLKDHLKHEMKGQHRVPTLLSESKHQPLEELNLSEYEVCPGESLHDIKGHITNIWEALTKDKTILSPAQLNILKETLGFAYGGKEKKKGCDYRKSAIMVHIDLCQRNTDCPVSKNIEELLYTLVVISKLAYQSAEERSPKTVLQTYTYTFRHALAMIRVFGKNWFITSVTNGKFYGLYYHSITTHFADIQRFVPLSSLHAEEEERTFSSINGISLTTSDRKVEHIRDNSIIRLQAEKNRAEREGQKSTWKSDISRLDKEFGPVTRSEFNIKEIEHTTWQAFLERIADYLLCGEGNWWRRDGSIVEFYDGHRDVEVRPEGPKLMDFMNFNFQSSKKEVKKCWEHCVQNEICLPLDILTVFDSEETLSKR